MPFLLDTNHCVYLLNAWDKESKKRSEIEQNIVTAVQNSPDIIYITAANILILAKRAGYIPSVKEVYNQMRQAGEGIEDTFYQRILEIAGE